MLNKYTEAQKHQIIVDFDRPGFAFVKDILSQAELNARLKLKQGGNNPQEDLILLAQWRSAVDTLSILEILPQKLSQILTTAIDAETFENITNQPKSPPIPPAVSIQY